MPARMAFAIPSFRPRTDAEMTASRRERPSSAATPWAQRLQTLADLGVGLMQLRCKDGSTDLRRRWLRCLRDALPEQVMLIVNDDLDALWDDDGSPLADGAHLGREDACALAGRSGLPRTGADGIAQGLRIARERLGEQLLLGTSTRTAEEIGRARDAGADHAGFGAMAASSTKGDTVLADRRRPALGEPAPARPRRRSRGPTDGRGQRAARRRATRRHRSRTPRVVHAGATLTRAPSEHPERKGRAAPSAAPTARRQIRCTTKPGRATGARDRTPGTRPAPSRADGAGGHQRTSAAGARWVRGHRRYRRTTAPSA